MWSLQNRLGLATVHYAAEDTALAALRLPVDTTIATGFALAIAFPFALPLELEFSLALAFPFLLALPFPVAVAIPPIP